MFFAFLPLQALGSGILLAWMMLPISRERKRLNMESRISVTISDYQRLMELFDLASAKAKMPDAVNTLYKNLMAARMFSAETIKENIVTMNSRVLLREISSGRETEITITYPRESDTLQKRVSVFSPIGSTLFGRDEGDIVSWKTPTGLGNFKILKVTYQPEAAGNYSL